MEETPTAAPGCCAFERTEDDVPPRNQAERFRYSVAVWSLRKLPVHRALQHGGTVDSTSVVAAAFAPLEQLYSQLGTQPRCSFSVTWVKNWRGRTNMPTTTESPFDDQMLEMLDRPWPSLTAEDALGTYCRGP